MISIRFEEKQQIGLQYALETLHGCSPFGQEKIRRLRFYTPAERGELETELYNVRQAALHAEQLKSVYDKICILLCQMKDIRNSIRRCRDGEIPDHVELFEIKGYLQRLESLLPLYAQMCEIAPLRELSFHDPKPGYFGSGQHPLPGLLHSRQHDGKTAAASPEQENAGGTAS